MISIKISKGVNEIYTHFSNEHAVSPVKLGEVIAYWSNLGYAVTVELMS